MLVEHTFITTIEKAEVFQRAVTLLRQFGFRRDADSKDDLLVSRGRSKPKKHSLFGDLPQSVAVSFDRGKVVLAVSVQPFRKVESFHRDVMVALASAIEAWINTHDEGQRSRSVDEQMDTIQQIEASFDEKVLKRKRRSGWAVCGCLIIVIGLIVVMILGATGLLG